MRHLIFILGLSLGDPFLLSPLGVFGARYFSLILACNTKGSENSEKRYSRQPKFWRKAFSETQGIKAGSLLLSRNGACYTQ